MIDLKDILEYCRLEAIANRTSPNDASIWRSICRTYSRLFVTPLHLVLEMDVEHVILNVFEEDYKKVDLEDFESLQSLMDTILSIEDPDYDANLKREQEEFDRQAIEEERERIKTGAAIHKSLPNTAAAAQKTLFESPEEVEEKRPTSGSINLSYLAALDKEE